MNTKPECLSCLLNQSIKTCALFNIPEQKLLLLQKSILQYLSVADLSGSPPIVSRKVWELIYKHLNNPDPYLDIKNHFNQLLLNNEESLWQKLNRFDNVLLAAIKQSIAANIIDFGAPDGLHHNAIESMLMFAQTKGLTIDHTEILLKKINQQSKILIIADNCGEILLDKLMIKAFLQNHPSISFIYAVRGMPIINDALISDAHKVGIDKYATIIDTNDNTPGIDFKRTGETFNDAYNTADIIISKGQGNYETLCEQKDKRLFFFLIAKCKVVAKALNVEPLSMICKHSI